MKKINRLLKNKDFKNVLDNKKSVASKEYVIYANKNDVNHVRIGVSVSSKIGNSVVRHRIKRQINEMLKESIDINSNYDFVLSVRNKYLSNNYQENKKMIDFLFSKIRKGNY